MVGPGEILHRLMKNDISKTPGFRSFAKNVRDHCVDMSGYRRSYFFFFTELFSNKVISNHDSQSSQLSRYT
jgi:light-regulated signal transduction histidine kinase (bacteriophytochrome)